jgi:hypothetical protein
MSEYDQAVPQVSSSGNQPDDGYATQDERGRFGDFLAGY